MRSCWGEQETLHRRFVRGRDDVDHGRGGRDRGHGSGRVGGRGRDGRSVGVEEGAWATYAGGEVL